MSPEAIQLLVLGLAGPASGIIIAIVSNNRSKRHEQQETTVAVASVRVDEKDAHTREIAMILDGYTKVTEAQTKVMEGAQKSASDCSQKYDALELRFNEAERVRVQERADSERRRQAERAELIDHIRSLEAMVPTPPGPPERPVWS